MNARLQAPVLRLPAPFVRAALLCATIVVGLFLAYQLIPDEMQRLVLSDIAAPTADLLAVGFLVEAARRTFRSSHRLGLAWAAVAAALFIYMLGDASWGILEAGLKLAPFPSIADVFYLTYYIAFLVAIHLLVVRRQSPGEFTRDSLDLSVVLAAAILGFGNFLIGPIFEYYKSASQLELLILAAYPVGDLVLLAALLLILYNDPNQPSLAHRSAGSEDLQQAGVPIFLVGAGISITIITDTVYTYQTMAGTYASGGVLDVGWIAGNLLVGMAGVAQCMALVPDNPIATFKPGPGFWARVQSIKTYLPYLWLVGAFGLLVYSGLAPLPVSFRVNAFGVSVILVLVVIRQIIMMAENQRLSRSLNRQAERLEIANRELNLEIAERLRVQEKLAFDVLHDQMTGLANRRLFLDRLGQAIKRVKRRSDISFGVLFLDLDQFKVVNDSLGHAFGDQLLIAVGRRLEDTVRSADTVARFGGDEFAILLDDLEDPGAAVKIAEKVRQAVAEPFRLQNRDVHTTASIGVATSLGTYDHPDDLLRDVDVAMYQAKALGKARCVLFGEEMRDQAFTRLALEEGLRNALRNGEFELYYQPITSLESDRIVALEALLRWRHPTRGLLLPAQFLSVAEEAELILPLGEWVMNEACRQLKAWQARSVHLADITVNINISNREFAQADLAEKVRRALESSGLPGASLRLEITERVLVDNYPTANSVVRDLNGMGVKVEIDDFGTGYSALAYLQQFPIDAIKIDKSFISDMRKNRKGLGLVRAIVSMARELGMETIAEGIETGEQLSELKGLLCGFGQGYLLSHPLEAEAAGALLSKQADQRTENGGDGDYAGGTLPPAA
jgi:diguanylate cyclase (GGDEF)-like protein